MADEQENIEQEIDLQALAGADDQQQEQQEEQQEQVEFSAIEQEAYDQGWRPKEEFSGRDGHWKTPLDYIVDGKYIDKIKQTNQKIDDMQRDFDKRLENTNKIHEARRQTEIKKLKTQQREAVNDQDTDAYDIAQTQLDDLEKQEVKTTTTEPGKDPAIAAWEEKNPWFNDMSDERGSVAVGIYNTFANQNKQATSAQVLAHVDARMDKLYPTNPGNPRRNQPNVTETPRRNSRQKGKSLSMNDLTNDERQEWSQFGSMMFTEAEFLKTVADTRTK
jgi:hypothetical protein